MSDTTCKCGCPRDAHGHYRRGSDCSACGCDRYRRPGWLSRFLDRRRDARGVRQVREAGRRAWDEHQNRRAS